MAVADVGAPDPHPTSAASRERVHLAGCPNFSWVFVSTGCEVFVSTGCEGDSALFQLQPEPQTIKFSRGCEHKPRFKFWFTLFISRCLVVAPSSLPKSQRRPSSFTTLCHDLGIRLDVWLRLGGAQSCTAKCTTAPSGSEVRGFDCTLYRQADRTNGCSSNSASHADIQQWWLPTINGTNTSFAKHICKCHRQSYHLASGSPSREAVNRITRLGQLNEEATLTYGETSGCSNIQG